MEEQATTSWTADREWDQPLYLSDARYAAVQAGDLDAKPNSGKLNRLRKKGGQDFQHQTLQFESCTEQESALGGFAHGLNSGFGGSDDDEPSSIAFGGKRKRSQSPETNQLRGKTTAAASSFSADPMHQFLRGVGPGSSLDVQGKEKKGDKQRKKEKKKKEKKHDKASKKHKKRQVHDSSNSPDT